MILIDTSVRIDLPRELGSAHVEKALHALRNETVVIGDLVLLESLQGVRHERDVARILGIVADLQRETLFGPAIAEKAAANHRDLRKRGLTIRGTLDVVIATWCIENGAAIILNDRDMGAMEAHLGLRAYA